LSNDEKKCETIISNSNASYEINIILSQKCLKSHVDYQPKPILLQ